MVVVVVVVICEIGRMLCASQLILILTSISDSMTPIGW